MHVVWWQANSHHTQKDEDQDKNWETVNMQAVEK